MSTLANPQIEQLAAWIRSRHSGPVRIDPDDDLIDTRLVDSLGFVEFIILIEKLSGRPIDLDTFDVTSLRSLNRIQRSFFA